MTTLHRVLLVSALIILPAAAQVPYDQTFAPDIDAPEGFRTNRTSYSAVMDVLGPTRPEVTDAQLDVLKTLQIENIWASLGEYQANTARGFHSTQPGERIVGRALTMRLLPPRPDLRQAVDTLAEEGNWDIRYYIRAGEEARPGDIVVAETGGANGDVFFGDVTALGIKLRGARGVVIDGGTRDLDELQEDTFAGFPVFARFFDPRGPLWVGIEWNVPIRVGSVSVLPGDVVVAEDEAMLFFPPQLVPQVLESALARQSLENYERNLLRQQMYRARDVYPLHPSLRQEYEKTRQPPPQ